MKNSIENLIEKYEKQLLVVGSEEMRKGIQMDIDALKRALAILKVENYYVDEQQSHS